MYSDFDDSLFRINIGFAYFFIVGSFLQKAVCDVNVMLKYFAT